MKTVAENWAEFERMALHPESPPEQRREMRRAFYLGVWSLFCDVAEMGSDAVSEEDGFAHLEGIEKECRDFKDRVIRGEA